MKEFGIKHTQYAILIQKHFKENSFINTKASLQRTYKCFHFLEGHISHPLGCTEIMWFTQFCPHLKHCVLNVLSIACTVHSVSIGT